MKKIIDGKRYNTDTAQFVAEFEYAHRGDLAWFTEALYRTPRGSWFLAGEGHANTRYAERIDQHTRGPGSGIIPLSAAEALRWCERHVDADTTGRYFDALIEDA